MITPLHYIMAVSDGRTEASEGLTLYQLAQIMKGQDCVTAYNLDAVCRNCDGGSRGGYICCGSTCREKQWQP